MYIDKGGACASFAAFQGIVELGLKVNVTCSIALAENIVSGTAYRTSDILTSYKGLTVEILNTDAEGRLVLADAMAWTQAKYKVHTMVELSTLTGAMLVALGEHMAGAFVTCDKLSEQLIESGSQSFERLWRMPFCEIIADGVKGKNSDLKNLGTGQWGGSIAAASFLKYFVNDGVKFAHIDMAGPVLANAPTSFYAHSGATGYGVGILLNYFRKQQEIPAATTQ